jgi:FkbM family methyltransferase
MEGKPFVHTVDAGPARGLRYPITLPADKGIWTGAYELELAQAMAQAVPRGSVCLDIGGWRGFFGGVMALAGAARVVIFEPLPANATQIRKMIELNPGLPVELMEAAVSETDGEIEFCLMPETSMGKLAASSFQAGAVAGERIKVRTVALDPLVAGGIIAAPAVIKIDVEGAELLVLRGARQILATHGPKLFMEIHSRTLGRDCRAFLTQLGYVVQTVEPGDPEVCHFIATRKVASL